MQTYRIRHRIPNVCCFGAMDTRHTSAHSYANNTPHYINSTIIYCASNTISVVKQLEVLQLDSFHHSSHKSP